MKLGSPRRVTALVAAVVSTGWAVACATDPGFDEPVGEAGLTDGGADSEAGDDDASYDDAGWPGANFGESCQTDLGCRSQQCTDVGQKAPHKVCTQSCQQGKSCPAGGYCDYVVGSGFVCVPDAGGECSLCETDADCLTTGDRCVVGAKNERYCARDCTFDGGCGSGYWCVTPDNVGLTPSFDADGGAGRPERICTPTSGACECDAKRTGATRTCTQQSGTLTCGGIETCNGSSGQFEGCTAGSPSPEVCDGADNDCNATADDGDPAVLCAAEGTPANASWSCSSGTCTVGACSPGFINYPSSLAPAEGCPCSIDEATPDDDCSVAVAAGSVTDDPAAQPSTLNLSGRLTSDTDVDWYGFDALDFDEVSTNGYHVSISFTAPTANNEFEFDVLRGATCAEPDAAHSTLATYDWCVDGLGLKAGQGEQVCGADQPIHCGPETSHYLVRVKRKAGATGTCDQYTLTVTARGGAPCDFAPTTGQCDPFPP